MPPQAVSLRMGDAVNGVPLSISKAFQSQLYTGLLAVMVTGICYVVKELDSI